MKKILLILSALTLTVCLTVGICVPAVAAPESYKNYVSVATQGSGLTIEPTLVLEPETEDQLDNKGFASVIVTPDAEMNVELGQKRSLKDLFDQKLKGKYIPVLRLTSWCSPRTFPCSKRSTPTKRAISSTRCTI